jgi:hypothetical protein
VLQNDRANRLIILLSADDWGLRDIPPPMLLNCSYTFSLAACCPSSCSSRFLPFPFTGRTDAERYRLDRQNGMPRRQKSGWITAT